jgi:hypothetical protein
VEHNSRIEIKVESIDNSIAMIKGSNSAARSILHDAVGIRLCAIKPTREILNALVGGELYAGVAEVVELVEIVERERRRVARDLGVVQG